MICFIIADAAAQAIHRQSTAQRTCAAGLEMPHTRVDVIAADCDAAEQLAAADNKALHIRAHAHARLQRQQRRTSCTRRQTTPYTSTCAPSL
jgi:hypothetical protein